MQTTESIKWDKKSLNAVQVHKEKCCMNANH